MTQVVHSPAVFDDQERDPLLIVPDDQYPYSENQGNGFNNPKDSVEDFFVARSGFIVGDVLKELPHTSIFPLGFDALAKIGLP